jgi:ubiquinone/menaquinone biosynthesis C-methylase UbiE
MSLSFTGERFLTECQGEMVYEHWHRYLLTREHASGKRVLDVASGEGYGSHLLAGVAESVVGVDLSEDAIKHASAKYAKENLRYIAASCTKIPLPDASFDFIVSFETIEHIDEASQKAFLSEVNRLLKPDGMFLISSPNRPEYSDKAGYKNEFHVHELDEQELRDQLTPYWPYSFWAAQRLSFYSLIWPIDRTAQSSGALTIEGESGFPEPMYFLVFCSKSEPAISQLRASLTLVTDKENSVHTAWANTYRQNVQLHERNQALEREIEALKTSSINSAIDDASNEHWLVRAAKKIVGQPR